MKKVLLVSAIAISSMFLAIGCGGDKEGEDNSSGAKANSESTSS